MEPGGVSISANQDSPIAGDGEASTGSSETCHPGQEIPDYQAHHNVEETEEPTVRSRFPQAQGTGITEEDSSLQIRIILPNNSTLSVDVQFSNTLGDIKT